MCVRLFCLNFAMNLFRESQADTHWIIWKEPKKSPATNEIILYFMFLQNIFENINKRHEYDWSVCRGLSGRWPIESAHSVAWKTEMTTTNSNLILI